MTTRETTERQQEQAELKEFWLNAKLLVRAPDLADAKEQLDAVLQGWARLTMNSDRGLSMYDRTDMVDEENK